MRRIWQVPYAFQSLCFGTLLGLITLVHHLHSALVLHPDGGAMHVVWIEIFMIPATILSMLCFLRTGSQIALWAYAAIAISGFVFLGLYEGGWNHTLKVLGYLRIDSPTTHIGLILPRDNVHLWFYELTGIATFLCALVASWFSLRFYIFANELQQSRI